MDSRWMRVLRGSIAASVATLVAAFSHVAAGGAAPSVLGLVATVVVAAFVCIALAGRRLSVVRLAIAVSVSQFLFHSVFTALGTPALVAGAADGMHHSPGSIAQVTEPVAAHADPTMWLGHVLAGVVTILAIAFGERAVRGLASTIALALTALVRVPSVATASVRGVRPPRAASAVKLPRDVSRVLATLRHRGPPAPSLAH